MNRILDHLHYGDGLNPEHVRQRGAPEPLQNEPRTTRIRMPAIRPSGIPTTSALRRSPAGRGTDDGAVPGVRHLAQDRPQDLRPLEGRMGSRRSRTDPQARTGGDWLPMPVEATIVAVRREKPSWGAPTSSGGSGRACRPPHARRSMRSSTATARSSIRGPSPAGDGHRSSEPAAPNDLWCVDFKGEFRLGNARLCYPLTVTDQVSRYLLMVEALEEPAKPLSSWHSSDCSRSAACRSRPAPTTASPSPAADATASLGSRSGGSCWASGSNASPRAGRSRTAGTSARISPSSGSSTRPPAANSLSQQARFEGQRLGLHEVDTDVWLVSFIHYDLGYIGGTNPASHRHPVRLEGVIRTPSD